MKKEETEMVFHNILLNPNKINNLTEDELLVSLGCENKKYLILLE